MSDDEISEIRARVAAVYDLPTAERLAELRALVALIPALLDEIERLQPVPEYPIGIVLPSDYEGYVA